MKKKLIIILLFLTPFVSFGQAGGFQGGNAAGGHIEDPIPDSIPLKITKFYTNNLTFQDSSGIDTLFHQFELIQGDENFNNAWMGNFTYPIYYTDFEKRLKSKVNDFYFLSNYGFFLKYPKDFNHYRTNRPYTKLYYVTSMTKETEQQSLELLHTQNVDFYTNFGLEYRALLSVEPVRKENSHISYIRAWIAKDKDKYSWMFNIFLDHVKTLHNGGVIDTAGFDPKLPQYYLTKAYSLSSYRGWDFNPQIKLYGNKKNYVKLQLYTTYLKSQRVYVDINPKASFYGNIYLDSNYTYDSVAYDMINNELRLKSKIKNLKTVYAFGQNLENFYLFRDYIYKQKGFWSNNFYVKGGIDYTVKNIETQAKATYFFTGRRSGDYSLSANSKISTKWLKAYIDGGMERKVPDYFLIHYYGNHDKWENNFIPSNIINASAGVSIPKLRTDMKISYYNVDNYLYFEDGKPVQLYDPFSVYRFEIRNSLSLSIFKYKSDLILQQSGETALNLPKFILYQSLYADFYLFKKAMRMNLGYDMYWTDQFNMYAYRPSIDAFYVVPGKETGNHPIINLFVNMKVKRVFIFIKMDFVNAPNLLYYSTVEHYHYPTYFMRFGAQWWFKN